MNREAQCGPGQAAHRLKVAQAYLELAQLAAGDVAGAAHNAAVGNAVLAGIAASDAMCCQRLGRHSRGQDHRAAVALPRTLDGEAAKALGRLLQLKDAAHYSDAYLTPAKVVSAVRSAEQLVQIAVDTLKG